MAKPSFSSWALITNTKANWNQEERLFRQLGVLRGVQYESLRLFPITSSLSLSLLSDSNNKKNMYGSAPKALWKNTQYKY